MIASLRAAASRALEAGWGGSAFGGWASGPILARGLVRELTLDAPHVRLVAVGGATIGGSGRTRVALAVTRALTAMGATVALVGHGYRASPARARVVVGDEALADVGDEAIACARALDGTAAFVVVGPDRSSAARLAVLRGARIVVVDGPLQLAPRRADLALLAVDAERPWGSGALLPFGDLRGRPEDLVALADAVVPVDAAPRRVDPDLRRARVGLFTAIARPGRLASALGRHGVAPVVTVSTLDHGPGAGGRHALMQKVRRVENEAVVDRWVATPKCALHLVGAGATRPFTVLEDDVALPDAMRARLLALAGPGSHAVPTPAHMGHLDPFDVRDVISAERT